MSIAVHSRPTDLRRDWLFPRRERHGLPVESVLAAVALVLAAVLPVLEIGLRTFLGTGLPGNSGYVQHLALWIGCLGAVVAARDGRHLTLVSRAVSWPEAVRVCAGGYVALVSTAVAGGLAWAGVQFVLAEIDAPARIGGWLPIWIAEAVIPAGFAGVTVNLAEGYPDTVAVCIDVKQVHTDPETIPWIYTVV